MDAQYKASDYGCTVQGICLWMHSTRHLSMHSTRHLSMHSTKHLYMHSTRHLYMHSTRHLYMHSTRHLSMPRLLQKVAKRYRAAMEACRVGQSHTPIYGVYTVFLAGKSPRIRSSKAYIHGSGQPYRRTLLRYTRKICLVTSCSIGLKPSALQIYIKCTKATSARC